MGGRVWLCITQLCGCGVCEGGVLRRVWFMHARVVLYSAYMCGCGVCT